MRRYEVNMKIIYAKIVKYGRTIEELAKEHNMTEEEFRARIKKGLDPRLYASAIKADEATKKSRQKAKKREEKKQEGNKMKNNRQTNRNPIDKKEIAKADSVKMDELTAKEARLLAEIEEFEKNLKESKNIKEIRAEAWRETKKVFEKAQSALNKAEIECDKANQAVRNCESKLNEAKNLLNKVKADIAEERKKKEIYLVAPGYTGEIPEFGEFFSTEKIKGFTNLQILQNSGEFVIKPDVEDMEDTGYDSLAEYKKALKFVMLCAEYICNEKQYNVLCSDERIKKLIDVHTR